MIGPRTWRALAPALAAAALVGGCGSSSDEPRLGEGEDTMPGGPAPGQSAEERAIRGWNEAVNLGDYERAADFFERGALVEQLGVVRLETRVDAIEFNRGLPCRADVTDVEPDAEGTVAAFRLREGRTGGCEEGGRARVRFVIRDGKFREWRQLPTPAAPSGEVAGAPRRVL